MDRVISFLFFFLLLTSTVQVYYTTGTLIQRGGEIPPGVYFPHPRSVIGVNHWVGEICFTKFFDWTNTLAAFAIRGLLSKPALPDCCGNPLTTPPHLGGLLWLSAKAIVQSSARVAILVPPLPLYILLIFALYQEITWLLDVFSWCKLFLLFHSCNFSLCSNSGLVNLCCTVKNKHQRHSLLI